MGKKKFRHLQKQIVHLPLFVRNCVLKCNYVKLQGGTVIYPIKSRSLPRFLVWVVISLQLHYFTESLWKWRFDRYSKHANRRRFSSDSLNSITSLPHKTATFRSTSQNSRHQTTPNCSPNSYWLTTIHSTRPSHLSSSTASLFPLTS